MPDIGTETVNPTMEQAVREALTRVVEIDLDPAALDLDADLAGEYGVNSLHKVMFLTTVCDDTGVDVAVFTEEDVAQLRSLREVAQVLSQHGGGAR